MSATRLPWARRGLVVLPVLTVLVCSCQSNESAVTPGTAQGPTPPVVTDARSDLVLSWFVDGGAQIGASVAEVPEHARKNVRVQDPTIPPEQRDTNWIFFADLERAGPNGRYPVRAQRRDQYERAQRLAEEQKNPAVKGASTASAVDSDKRLVMYATKQCPVCKKARRWLLQQGIPYVEKDIERDAAAAAELQKKGRAQGVPTNGVPVFEIDGKLVPGFDPSQLQRLLAARSGTGNKKALQPSP